MTRMRVTLAALLGLAPLLYAGELMAEGQGGTAKGKEGAACHVVGGPNTGKSGTYDKDGDCAGSWGATECGGSNTGKCQDGAKVLVNGSRATILHRGGSPGVRVSRRSFVAA